MHVWTRGAPPMTLVSQYMWGQFESLTRWLEYVSDPERFTNWNTNSKISLPPSRPSTRFTILNMRYGCIPNTARKEGFSTGREPPVCTGFPTGTAPPVLSARALSTDHFARY